jgi:multidrug resistance efflux pump
VVTPLTTVVVSILSEVSGIVTEVTVVDVLVPSL